MASIFMGFEEEFFFWEQEEGPVLEKDGDHWCSDFKL